MPIARAIPTAPSHELLRLSKGNAAPWLFLEGTFNEPSSLCELEGWNHCLGGLVPPSGVVCRLPSDNPCRFPTENLSVAGPRYPPILYARSAGYTVAFLRRVTSTHLTLVDRRSIVVGYTLGIDHCSRLGSRKYGSRSWSPCTRMTARRLPQ